MHVYIHIEVKEQTCAFHSASKGQHNENKKKLFLFVTFYTLELEFINGLFIGMRSFPRIVAILFIFQTLILCDINLIVGCMICQLFCEYIKFLYLINILYVITLVNFK